MSKDVCVLSFLPVLAEEALWRTGRGWEEQMWTGVQQQLALSAQLQMVVGGVLYSPLLGLV